MRAPVHLVPVVALLLLDATACKETSRSRSLVVPPAMSRAAPRGPNGATIPGYTDDGQWPMASKDYSNSRYSTLDEITPANAAGLQLKSTFSLGVLRGQEAAPLVVNNTMYVITAFPNYVYALDLTQPGYPTKWTYKPKPELSAQGVACCDVVNRGMAFSDGKIFLNTLDAHTIAIDANTGKEVWNTKLGDINLGETITMAPLVVKGKVLVGNSGGEMGVRGWVTALDAGSGRIAWRAFNTGPDSEVKIGPSYKPFYASERGKDLGVTSWPPDAWKIGGATVWGWIAYDPGLDLIYYGTGNPGPWNDEQRPGDNKFSAGLFARDPDDGQAAWFYQFSPHDLFDYDAINENVLVDLPVNGASRKVILRAERNGYIYVIDRTSGQVLSATPYVPITSTSGVDLKTGRLQYVLAKRPHLGEVVREICPAATGAKDWQPTAFSAHTGLLYIPHQNLCMDFEGVEANYIAGTPYVGANVKMYAGPGGNRGFFTAWDPIARRPVWQVKESFPVYSGTVVTGGDVVFYGTMDGWFKALDARNGTELWKFKVSSGIVGQPISYRGPDGHQYIAVLSGVGGWAGAVVAGGLDTTDATAALGFVNAMKDLPSKTTKGGTLYIFGL